MNLVVGVHWKTFFAAATVVIANGGVYHPTFGRRNVLLCKAEANSPIAYQYRE
jgi:hypothetical protein